MQPDVSIIIPTWNRKEKLVRAVQSVLDQEKVSVEVLICDDGSQDGTVELFSNWPDLRVRLICGSRGGLPAVPRNRGLSVAKGEWIAFLDDDDYWLPQKSRKQLDLIRQYNLRAVGANALRIVDGVEAGTMFPAQGVPNLLTFADLIRNNFLIASSVMLHRSLLDKIGNFAESVELKAYEDYALWLRVSSLVNFGYVDEPLLYYSDMPGCSIRASQPDDRKAKVRVFKDWLCWAKSSALSINGVLLAKQLFMTSLSPEMSACISSTYGSLRRRFMRKF